MNWFTDRLYDLGASPRAGEAAWGELAAQDAMSPATRASYYAGSEMPPDPRHAAWRSAPRMGDTVAPPSDTAWMLPQRGQPTWEAAHRFGASGLTPPPARSEADAYRMGGLAETDRYKPNTWRDIDRQAIENQYGGTDIHGIKLPPVSEGEPKAWVDAIVGETPADALVNWGLGGTGKLAKGALALGGLFKLADPAEAGVLSKAGELLRGKVGGPWEGGIRAYHSSPHDFDKFDWSKLRTGEGANVYGSGFYFAENPAVSGQGGEYWNQFKGRFSEPEIEAADILRAHEFDRAAAAESVKAHADEVARLRKSGTLHPSVAGNYTDPIIIDSINRSLGRGHQEVYDLLSSGRPIGPRTYEVNIAARPELMLDWDKPLKQQPKAVQQLFAPGSVQARNLENTVGFLKREPQGEQVYRALGLGPDQSSEALRDAGIPGIRYLDQGSRSGGPFRVQSNPGFGSARAPDDPFSVIGPGNVTHQKFANRAAADAFAQAENAKLQTYNYVVTDPSKLDILAKYGMVGGVPMGALAAQDQYQR